MSGFERVRVMQAGLVDMGDVMPTSVAGDICIIEGADPARLGAVVLGSWRM